MCCDSLLLRVQASTTTALLVVEPRSGGGLSGGHRSELSGEWERRTPKSKVSNKGAVAGAFCGPQHPWGDR